MNKVRIETILLLVVLLAGFLRFASLGTNPPGLYCDEASKGYEAYSIMNTGKDRWGTKLPVFFRLFGEYNEGLYIYAIVPFVKIFGLNEFSVRMPSALIGFLSVAFLFFLVRDWFNERTALLCSLFLALSPWHIHLSRVCFRAVFLPFFLIGGLYFLNTAFRKKKWHLYLSTLFFALSMYTYSIAIVFVPILFTGIFIIYWNKLKGLKKEIIISAALFLIMMIPTIHYSIANHGMFTTRFNSISVFSANESMFGAIKAFIGNMLSYYSPAYLFFKGDSLLRHSPAGFGQLYIFQLPLLLAGIYFSIKERKQIIQILNFNFLFLF